MKHTYTTKRCNAVDAATDIFDGAQEHLMAYDMMDFYPLFGSTTSTYAKRYKFLSKINSPFQLMTAFEVLGIELRGRNLLIHITFPENMHSCEITCANGIIRSMYCTLNNEIVIIPTRKRGVKFWQVKLYIFDK